MTQSGPEGRLDFFHDDTGNLLGLVYNGKTYYYIRNGQNDITGILDATGAQVVSYAYDSWGKLLSVTGDEAETIGALNPFRYRGYYYDSETALYYLNSRYYDPQAGRFINADGYVSTGQDLNSTNMFTYCGNNPVNRADPSGAFWKEIGNFFKKAGKAIGNFFGSIFGAGSSTTSTIDKNNSTAVNKYLPASIVSGVRRTQTLSKRGNSNKPVSVYANHAVDHPITSSSVGAKLNVSKVTLKLSLALDDISITAIVRHDDYTESASFRLNLSQIKVGFEGAIETPDKWDKNAVDIAYTNTSINGWFLMYMYALATTGQTMPDSSYNPQGAPQTAPAY